MRGNAGKLVAATAGACLCLVALAAWRLPTSGSPPGLDLRLIVVPPGELTVEPVGVLASARALQAGEDRVGGSFEASNIAGRRLLVRPLALPSVRGLAPTIHLRIATAGEVLAEDSLAALERQRGAGVEIPPRDSRQVEVSAWIPAGESGYRGRILDVTVELRSHALRGSG
jgi:hypothetical protein